MDNQRLLDVTTWPASNFLLHYHYIVNERVDEAKDYNRPGDIGLLMLKNCN